MCIGDFGEQEVEGGSWASDAARGVKDETTAEGELRMARLVRTIEAEIVPRLVLARRVWREPDTAKSREVRAPDAADIRELVRLLLAHDVAFSSAYVEAVRNAGASLEVICLQLLAPAARELGLLWEEDECDFMQVTVGLCRLHQLLRELSPEFRVDEAEPKMDRRILLAPLPGEQHTFGSTLVAQFLRRAGWEVWHEFPAKDTDILEVLRENWFAVVGLSISNDTRLDDVAKIITRIRCISRNRSVGILVGGPLLVAKPEVAALVGADATACDGKQAVERAEQMCRNKAVNYG
jgi:methanogenic corrinoid protein MtbC1